VRVLANGYFTQMGVRVRTAPTAGNSQRQHLEGAKLLWLESPSNPGLDVCDIAALVTAAHEAGALVAVDNTTPTILGQQPLALGADFSVASDTKALTGHADLILGHVAVREQKWGEQLHTWRTQMGAIPGPTEVWLAHRSLLTLDVRLERQCKNALAIARFLAARPEVESVRYPGLPDDPAHLIAARQCTISGRSSASCSRTGHPRKNFSPPVSLSTRPRALAVCTPQRSGEPAGVVTLSPQDSSG